MSDLFRLDGKVAIITGSSRGIGRAIAETMAAYGAAVVISSRKLEACEAVRDAIIAQGGRAIALRCNTSSRDDLAALLHTALQEFGRLDAVVAKAMAKRPEDRPASSHVLREQLLACASAGKWGNARAAKWWSAHKQGLRSGGAEMRRGVAEQMTVTRLAE